jgi:hypothetical protein
VLTCGSVLFLFTSSFTGLRNTKRSSCWPPAAQAANETYTRKPLAQIKPNSKYSVENSKLKGFIPYIS